MGSVFKAIFLLGFFGFLHLSNKAPHSYASFNASRHLVAGDVLLTKSFMKIIIKWSKTIQNRDTLHFISLPRLRASVLCPYKTMRTVLKLYSPQSNESLFQWVPMTGSRIRKCLMAANRNSPLLHVSLILALRGYFCL